MFSSGKTIFSLNKSKQVAKQNLDKTHELEDKSAMMEQEGKNLLTAATHTKNIVLVENGHWDDMSQELLKLETLLAYATNETRPALVEKYEAAIAKSNNYVETKEKTKYKGKSGKTKQHLAEIGQHEDNLLFIQKLNTQSQPSASDVAKSSAQRKEEKIEKINALRKQHLPVTQSNLENLYDNNIKAPFMIEEGPASDDLEPKTKSNYKSSWCCGCFRPAPQKDVTSHTTAALPNDDYNPLNLQSGPK